MGKKKLPDALRCVMLDNVLRWQVESETRPSNNHLCELGHFIHKAGPFAGQANGECSCENFSFNLGPLLKQGVTPEEAVARKLVKFDSGKELLADALRCKHLRHAFNEFNGAIIPGLVKSQEQQAEKNKEKARTRRTVEAHPMPSRGSWDDPDAY